MLVSGEAGVGKTRLVAEFADARPRSGCLVLIGGCIDLGEGASRTPRSSRRCAAWSDGPTPAADDVVGPGRAELARLVPDLGPVAAEASGAGLSIGSAQGRLFELLLGILGRLAARAPVVLVVEDLHWSDRSTLDLLAFLVRNLRDLPVVLVLTYRSDELHRRHPLLPFLAELERSGRVERLELHASTGASSAALLRAIAGPRSTPGSSRPSTRVQRQRVLRRGAARRRARRRHGRAAADAPRRAAGARRDLAEPTQELLRVASAAGQRVDPALLADGRGHGRTAALRRPARDRRAPGPGRRTRAPASSATCSATRCSRRPSTTTCCPASARACTPPSPGRWRRPSRRRPAPRPSSPITGTRRTTCRAPSRPSRRAGAAEASYAFPEALAQYERALELWDRVPERGAGRQRSGGRPGRRRGRRAVQRPGPRRGARRGGARAGRRDADPVRAGLLHVRLGRYAWIAGQGELAIEAHRTAVRLIPPIRPGGARSRCSPASPRS